MANFEGALSLLAAGWNVPVGKYGTIAADPTNPLNHALTFSQRTSGTDSYGPQFDASAFSAPGSHLTLSFSFWTLTGSSHAALIGFAHANGEPVWIAGSPSAQGSVGFGQTFSGGAGWQTVTLDANAVFAAFAPSELTGLRLVFESWDSGLVSASPFYFDSISVTGTSAIPEPSCMSCVLALAAAGLVVWRRRGR